MIDSDRVKFTLNKSLSKQRIIAVDFDNTICLRNHPVRNVRESLNILKKDGWFIIINTCRSDCGNISQWLQFQGIPYDLINEQAPNAPKDLSKKIKADVYVDDRAIRFNGDWETTLREVQVFEPWFNCVFKGIEPPKPIEPSKPIEPPRLKVRKPRIPSMKLPERVPDVKAQTHKVGFSGKKVYDYQDQGREVGPRIRDLKRPYRKSFLSGYSEGMSVEDIANKHKVSTDKIEEQLKQGTKVEYEHTNDETLSRKIALDHLVERPDYYDRLEEMEKEPVKKSTKVSKPKLPKLPESGSYFIKGIEFKIPNIEGFMEDSEIQDNEVVSSVAKNSTPDQWIKYWNEKQPELVSKHNMTANALTHIYKRLTKQS